MKTKNIIIKFYLLLLMFSLSFNISKSNASSSINLINSRGMHKGLLFSEINGNKYFNPETSSDFILEKGKFSNKDFSIKNGIEKLKFIPGAFLVRYDSDDKSLVAQMTSPVISIKNKIFVPLYSFFAVLDSMKIYNVEISTNSIKISKIGGEIVEEEIVEPTFESIKFPRLESNFMPKESQNISSFTSGFKNLSYQILASLKEFNPESINYNKVVPEPKAIKRQARIRPPKINLDMETPYIQRQRVPLIKPDKKSQFYTLPENLKRTEIEEANTENQE